MEWSWYYDHGYEDMIMKTMRAGEFKTRCLNLMDQVQKTREPLVITKRGKPVAKLVPADKPGNDIFGCLKGEIKIVGDIESPLVPPEDWEALR
jgi:prevent-host-death family protein